MKLKFLGATETVTGSKHLLITTKGKQYLMDCGLFQGKGQDNFQLNAHLGLDPAKLEAVILSHAHVDHSGLLPYLYKSGFKGKIYCTPGTEEICGILLMDSAHIQENDIYYINKKRERKNLDPIKPLYTVKDAEKCLKQFRSIPYHSPFRLCNEVELTFSDAGHILGSAVVNLLLHDGDKHIRLTFSGDVGRYHDLLLRAPEKFPQADYIICESTYGDRLHDNSVDAELHLLKIVQETCVQNKGKLIIPAFSLGRTQEIVFSLDKMKNAGLLPKLNVYVDSPLSTNATDIMRRNLECLNEQIQNYVKKDPDPFGFNNLHYITKIEDSQRLNSLKEPCIIISASGMADAGRVKHHIKNNIESEKNTILITGYCSPGTLGRNLMEGDTVVRIFGEDYPVKARVESIASYSAHADYEELMQFLSCQDVKKVKKVFLVHGEEGAKKSFKEKLDLQGFSSIEIPSRGTIFDLV